MPFTLAHPAAVIPLKKWCPKIFCLEALVAGSISPDLPYFIHAWQLSSFAHTLMGSFIIDLPLSAVALTAFYLFKGFTVDLLPSPHSQFMDERMCTGLRLSFAGIFALFLSFLVGTWTHIIWDSLTHSDGWVVCRTPALMTPLTLSQLGSIPIYHLLQLVSSVVGIVIIAAAYARSISTFETYESGDDNRAKVVRLLGLFAVSVVMSIALTFASRPVDSILHTGFLLLVNGMAIFSLLLVLMGTATRYLKTFAGKR